MLALTSPVLVRAEESSTEDRATVTSEATESSTATSSTDGSSSSTESTSSSKSTESSTIPSSESSTQSSSQSSSSTTESTASSSQASTAEKPKPKPEETPTKEATESSAEAPAVAAEPTKDSVESSSVVGAMKAQSSDTASQGVFHFEKDESVESFIRKFGESARKIGQENDLYASVMIAQAILESASGQSTLAQAPNYNLFGIKGSYKGKSVSMATQEDSGSGALYTIQAGFRVYENYEESLADYAQLMKQGISGTSTYYSGVWKENAETYQAATKFLTGRYATDTQYNQKLNGLIETYELTKYDQAIQGPEISKEGYKVPVNDYTISSPYGPRGGEFHRGLDMAAAQGEPIYASKAGIVLKAEYHASWGNYVVIQHADGMTSLYAHQQQYSVKPGDQVEQGQVIGYVGSTGNSTGSHLHLEFCLDSSLAQEKLIDPKNVLF